METYKEFLKRINSFELKKMDSGNKNFTANPSLPLKVGNDNAFKNFYGDTVVFKLNETVKTKLASYIDILYSAVPECFCERLDAETLHVTLHDLSNSPALNDVEEDMVINQSKINGKAGEIRKFAGTKIRLKYKFVFNMVNTSLVLGLYPSCEDDYNSLMALYAIFDSVKKLNYPFTPHITLAYYNVNGFDARSADKLASTVNAINAEIENEETQFEISAGSLYYQTFKSMNDYYDSLKLL